MTPKTGEYTLKISQNGFHYICCIRDHLPYSWGMTEWQKLYFCPGDLGCILKLKRRYYTGIQAPTCSALKTWDNNTYSTEHWIVCQVECTLLQWREKTSNKPVGKIINCVICPWKISYILPDVAMTTRRYDYLIVATEHQHRYGLWISKMWRSKKEGGILYHCTHQNRCMERYSPPWQVYNGKHWITTFTHGLYHTCPYLFPANNCHLSMYVCRDIVQRCSTQSVGTSHCTMLLWHSAKRLTSHSSPICHLIQLWWGTPTISSLTPCLASASNHRCAPSLPPSWKHSLRVAYPSPASTFLQVSIYWLYTKRSQTSL